MEAVQHDMPTVNQESPLPTHAIHVEPPPPQTTTSDNQNQPLHPPIHEHTPSAPTQTLWQPPENSNLQWVWLDGDGPFLTNATLGHSPVKDNLPGFNFEINFKTTGLANEANAQSTTLVAQVAVHVNSATTPDDSLHHKMHDARFRFEAGDSSRPPQSSFEDEALELHLAQFHIETTDTMPWFNLHTTINDQHVPRPNNPKLLLHKPNSPGPPFQNLLTTNPPPMHSTHTSWSIPYASGPQAHANPNSLDSPLPQTQHSPLSLVNPSPLLSLPDIPHNTTTTTRKRLRKEFRRLGRNIRQRLFCGLFRRELTGKQKGLDAESIMGFDEISESTNAATTPQDPTQEDGFWEADPNQLPKES